MKKLFMILMIVLCSATSIILSQESGRKILTVVTPEGEKCYYSMLKSDLYKYRSLIKDSTIYSDGSSSYIRSCTNKYYGTDGYKGKLFESYSFDTLGNFNYVYFGLDFDRCTSAKLWLDKYNEGSVFKTTFRYSDIDLLDTKKKYFVYDTNNDSYIEISRNEYSTGCGLSMSVYDRIPPSLKALIDEENKTTASQGKKKKSKTKKSTSKKK